MLIEPQRVLVIEDDPDTRSNLCDILEIDGYAADSADSVAAALHRDNWRAYFAVILDWKLPDGSAETLLPMLRELAPKAAVIVSTGEVGLSGAVTALRHGAVDYIVKPIDPDALRARIGSIAEQQRLKSEKERSEAAFRHLVEAAGVMIVILRPDRSIAYFNPFAEELTGYNAAEIAGRDYFQLFLTEATQAAVAEQMTQILAGTPTRGFENAICCRNGETRWLVWNAQWLDDYEGAPALLAIGQDISERKLAEERLLQAERLAAMGRAITGLAHESRNALQRSQAGLEMLARRVGSLVSQAEIGNEDKLIIGNEALQLIARVQQAQDDLHRLYEEVRQYSAPATFNIKPANLHDLVREEWDHLSVERTNRTVCLLDERNGLDLRCDVDAFVLRQCFRNILENSLAACGDPTEIRVTYAEAAIRGQPAIQIAIRDNGPGLTAEQQRRIFEEFYTTKTQGTGLGMAICRRFVAAHGGRVEALSVNGLGAEIRITLPRKQFNRDPKGKS